MATKAAIHAIICLNASRIRTKRAFKSPGKQKFFAAFFQKSSASFLALPSFNR